MSATAGDKENSLKSTASSETLVSTGASAPSLSRPTYPAQDSFYERTTPTDDEVPALDQWLQIHSHRQDHHSTPLETFYQKNPGKFRNYVYLSYPWMSRFEEQDAVPHPSHRNNRMIVGKSSAPYKPQREYPTVMSAVQVSEERPVHRLVVLGSKGVGKRTFTIQFIMKAFIRPKNPAMEKGAYHGQAVIDGASCTVGIMDTTAMEGLNDLLEERIKQAEAFVLLYSIWSRSSFEQIREIRNQICEMRPNCRAPILLFGNRFNAHDNNFIRPEREVSEDEGYSLANELGGDFIEASLSRRCDVEKGVFDLVRSLRRQNEKAPASLQSNEEVVAAKVYSEGPEDCHLISSDPVGL